jgi:hypothetical protein
MEFAQITLRRAADGDRRTLARLAELDSTALPDDEFLLGEVAGVPWAAVGLTTGLLVADPFRPTTEVAELLHLRAQALRAAAAPPWRRLMRRGAPTRVGLSPAARR